MVKVLMRRLPVWLLLCLSPALVLAQSECPAIVETALSAVDQFCQEIGRNQACYGNIAIDAQAKPAAQDFRFESIGDVANVADLQSLRLSPLDEANGRWGVAVMRLQANIPDTLPGQNVTFLMFGDVEISAVEDEGQRPMQAFSLRTGAGDAACDEAPESGLLVQTPEGVEEVAFNINGVDVQMGSTVLFQTDSDNSMSVSTLEGAAFVGAQDGTQFIVPGSWVNIALDENGRASAAPGLPESYERRTRLLAALPLRILQRRIEIAPPLTPEQLQRVRERIEAGQLPCGEEPFPPCAKFRRFLETRIAICRDLPLRRRPPFCGNLRDFLETVIFPAGTMTAEIAAPAAPPQAAPMGDDDDDGGSDDDD